MKLKNSALQELYDTVVASTITISPYEASPIDKAFKECDEKLSESITFAHIKDLEDRNDILETSNSVLLDANMESFSKTRKLEKEIEELKKQNENLASQYQKLTIENKRLQDANTTLEKASDDRTNLQEVVDKLSGENRSLNARVDCLRLEVNWYRKHFKEQSDEILGLKSRLNRGQTDLWNMLQNVNDAKPFELATCFPDVTCMDDILSWNLEDFLDTYKSWQEKKGQERIKHMRDYLERFCRGRLCSRCPLWSDEYKCSCVYSFNGAHPIPDEDIKRYYEKARAFSKPICHKDGWTCTLEGTVEIDKDLLKKVCGINSDD